MQRSIGIRALGTILCAILFTAVIYAQSDVPPSATVSTVEAAKWREDLHFMATEMPKRHKNLFHTMTREQFQNAVKRLDERIPTLARHQIIVEMMRIGAMVGDGHTSLNSEFNSKIGFRYYPVRLYLYADGLFIQAADREHAEAVGARVLKIGKASADEAFKAVSEVVPRDNEMTLKHRVPLFLVMPEVLQALGIIDDMEKAPLLVEKNGKQMTIELRPAGPLPQRGRDGQYETDPTQHWVKANDGAQAPVPLWLKAPRDNYWFEYLANEQAVYVQYNRVFNKTGESMADFSVRLFEFVKTHPVDRLILDVRLNEGGNGYYNMPLLLGLIKSEKINRRGHLFTIIGRGTFSAAQLLVNELERYTNTLFVGEPTGARVNFYGDHEPIRLPNSGITALVSTLWWQTMNPNDNRRWVAPQIVTELTSEDYRTNNDPALNAILNYKSIAEVLMPALQAGDIASAIKQYREFKLDKRTSPINTESEINSLGYQLMGMNRPDQAIQIFKLNVESYPHSSNAYDSLGDAYSQSGNKDLAIKSYEKALQLDPANFQTAEKLRAIRKD
jgi:hypothetical protein